MPPPRGRGGRGRGGFRGGRGRGGGGFRGGMMPMYGGYGMGNGMGVQQPIRKFNRPRSFRIQFKAMDDTMEHKSYSVAPSNLEYFHGAQHIFTTQHKFDFTIDGKTYHSVDHYYQKMKVEQLTSVASEKFDDPATKNYSNVAREILRLQNISRKSIDQWRVTCGVEVIQKALLEKTRQCAELKGELVKTGDKIIVHTFAGDDFFGTGCPIKYVKDWATGMEKNKIQVKFPMSFPLTPETVKHTPIFSKGRNVLGVILMILREKINTNQIDNLSVTLSPVSQYVTTEYYTPKSGAPANGATGAAGDAAAAGKKEIDFTMDYEEVDSITEPTPATAAKATAAKATPAATAAKATPAATAAKATPKVEPAAAAGKVKIALPGKAPAKK